MNKLQPLYAHKPREKIKIPSEKNKLMGMDGNF